MKRKDAQKQVRELAKNEENIVFASQDISTEFQPEIDEFLLCCFGIRGAWISDISSCGDFGKSSLGNWRRIAVQAFGIDKPERDALLIDIARAIREKRAH